MALEVIGAGFGRTGTLSLNTALEMIGLGPCHHMQDVNRSEHQKRWFRAAGRGEPVDWDEIYAGYQSAVDWPTAYFWRELADRYPKARIIRTRRDPDAWYKSFSETIGTLLSTSKDTESFAIAVINRKIFSGRTDDAAHCKAVFEAHNAEVIATIPHERLLVFEATDGWQPLCRFLGLPVPAEPYPASNSTAEFRANIR